MVVAAPRPAQHGAGLHHRRAAELAPPDHERAVEHAAPLQVGHQRRRAAVGLAAVVADVARHVRVPVPALVVDGHEAHAPFHEPPGHETGPGEARLAGIAAIQRQRLGRLVGEVHQLRRRGLQPVRHLVGGDARGDLRIAVGRQAVPVESRHHPERIGRQPAVGPGRTLHVEDRGSRVAEPRAGMHAGQEAARPIGRAAADARSRAHHHEGGQFVALAAQPVGHPGAEAGPARLPKAAVHEDLRGGVVELVGAHAFHDGDVVHHRGQSWQHLGDLGAALAVAGEGELRPHHGGVGADEGVALAADHLGWDRFAFHGAQLRLVVEHVELAGGARHEQLDHGLGPAGKVGRLRGQGAPGHRGGSRPLERPRQESGQRDLSHAHAALAEEVPPRHVDQVHVVPHRFTIASSRFITARATSIQAARSAASAPPPTSLPASSAPEASRSRCSAR